MNVNNNINIKEYIWMFKKRRLIILIIMILSLCAGFLLKFINEKSQIPIYQTSARIRINTAKNSPEVFSPNITAMNQNISQTYLSLAKSKYTLNEMKKLLNSNLSPEEIGGKYTLTPDGDNAEFININVTDTDPKRAVKIANTVPDAFNSELIKTINLDCIQIIDKAPEPTSPLPMVKSSAPIKMLLVGTIVSIFVVLLLEFLNNKIVTPKDVEEHWDIPLLGVVPYEKPKKDKKAKVKEKEVN